MSDHANTEAKLSKLVSQAASDETLKTRLLHDTTNVLMENGIEIPAGTEPQATLDNDSITFRFAPQNGTSQLSESDLSQAVGGAKGQMYLVFTFKLVAVKTVSWS